MMITARFRSAKSRSWKALASFAIPSMSSRRIDAHMSAAVAAIATVGVWKRPSPPKASGTSRSRAIASG
jgi:hypothetical protein